MQGRLKQVRQYDEDDFVYNRSAMEYMQDFLCVLTSSILYLCLLPYMYSNVLAE